MLHINILKLHVVCLDVASASAVFLSIHAGGADFCISTSLFEFNTAVFNQALHVAVEGSQSTEITLMASILLKSGQFESRGKCNFLCSEKDHGVVKQIGLLGGKEITLQSSIVLSCTYESMNINTQSPSVVSTFMTPVGLQSQSLGQQRRSEAEFLLARRNTWGAEREVAFDKRKEGVINSVAVNSSRDPRSKPPVPVQQRALRPSQSAGETRPPAAGAGAKAGKAQADDAPKLRRTTMNVGYVAFWPDKDDAVAEEDRLLLKLRMAEERRQAILREAEAKIRDRNLKLNKQIEKIRTRKPERDLSVLKKVLAEKEVEIDSMRQLLARMSRDQVESLLRGDVFREQHERRSVSREKKAHIDVKEKTRASSADNAKTSATSSKMSKDTKAVKRNHGTALKAKRLRKKRVAKVPSRIKMRRDREASCKSDDDEGSDGASLDLYSQIEALKSDIKEMCHDVASEAMESSHKRDANKTPARPSHAAEGVQLVASRPIRTIAANTATVKTKTGKTPNKQSNAKQVGAHTSLGPGRSMPRYSPYTVTRYLGSKMDRKVKSAVEPSEAPKETAATKRSSSALKATTSSAQKVRPPSVDIRRKARSSPARDKMNQSRSKSEFPMSSLGRLLLDENGDDMESALQRFLLESPSTDATNDSDSDSSPLRTDRDALADLLQSPIIKALQLGAPTPDTNVQVAPAQEEASPAPTSPPRPLKELEVRVLN